MMPPDTNRADVLALRWWPTWGLVAALAVAGRLPWRVRLWVGRALGRVMRLSMLRRRRIAEANLAYCFDGMSQCWRDRVLRGHFRELGIAVLETAAAWSLPGDRLDPMLRVRGFENLDRALEGGRGVLMVTAHLTSMEMAMQLLSRRRGGYAIYRRNKNPVLDRIIHSGRSRHGARLFDREDMRTLLSALRDNQVVWFSPDQDHGLTQGAFVDFFGKPAATVTTTARIAARTGAAVVPLVYRRLPGCGGYDVQLLPALEGFPGDDLVTATRRLNQFMEQQVILAPDQYLWVHRRFKTRPAGCEPLYP